MPAPVTLQDRLLIDPLAAGEATGAVVPVHADAVVPAAKRPARRRSRSKASAGSTASSLPGQGAIDLVSRQASTESGDAHVNDPAPLPFETQAPADLESAASPVSEPLPDDAPVATTPPARQRRSRPSRRRAAQSGQAPSGILRASDSVPALNADVTQDALPANLSLPGTTSFATVTPSVDSPTPNSTWMRDASLTEPAQAGLESSASPDSREDEPAAGWAVDEPLFMSAPGGELDGAEALARLLLEMFPPVDADSEQEPTENGTSLEALENAIEPDEPAEDEDFSGLPGTLPEADGAGTDTDATPRRGRRGRRGGRGRRRGALHVVPEPDADATNGVDVVDTTPAQPGLPQESLPDLFTPDTAGRQEQPWREHGPQRRWGRTFSRNSHASVSMPPPKPSQTGRFAPIPQAVPPSPVTSPIQSRVAQIVPRIELPDFSVDAPLAPGETRTERLLDVQNRLLRAMIEGQSRQIEALSANVGTLQQAVQELSASASSRGFKPRTAIFVDAPNVCYAAANARVNLDYGRMLKYFSRDRHLVHALSYSPIIDDVREGIRYETQRFVAPFLRTGYKLITKPLKRFSDGSAKGNFDLELALDILTMADRLDVVVLVSGDSDFECVIEHIQQRGVRVEVVAFASNVSTELVNIADSFIDIMQHVEHFRAL